METNRTQISFPGWLDIEIFDGFGEDDSIVDRLLSLPVLADAEDGKANAFDKGVARRLEKVLADHIRERIEGNTDE